jgi:hypothetical protein
MGRVKPQREHRAVAVGEDLHQRWYQVLLRGPTKVEYLFLEHSQEPVPPVEPSRDALVAITTHFWDWIWWLATKASVGRDDLVAEHLPQLDAHLLRPMGVATTPRNIDAAIGAFVACRDALEDEYGISVPRALEDVVRRGIRRVQRGRSMTPRPQPLLLPREAVAQVPSVGAVSGRDGTTMLSATENCRLTGAGARSRLESAPRLRR